MREFLDRVQAAAGDDGRLSPGPMASWDVFPFVAAWADMLPPTPAEELDARATLVRDTLAHAG